MKALLLTDHNHFAYTDVEDPALEDGQVLVAVKAAGICGSDVHGMDGSTGRRRPPIVMGHEAAGVITEITPGVVGWQVGDRVTFDSTVYCGACEYCRAGRVNLCENRSVLGVSCEDYRRDGAFAEFVAVPQHILYRLPEALSFARAATVEPVSIAAHATNRTAIRPSDTALVIGTGVIGLLVIQTLRVAGCGRIIAVDLDAGRLALAATLGADETIRADEADTVAEVRHRTGGRGADVVVEAVGLETTFASAVACAAKGGQVTLVGNLSPHVPLALQTVVTRELTLNGSCASCGEYPACLDLLARGAVRVDPLISATAPLADGAAWFDRLHAAEPGLMKVILTP